MVCLVFGKFIRNLDPVKKISNQRANQPVHVHVCIGPKIKKFQLKQKRAESPCLWLHYIAKRWILVVTEPGITFDDITPTTDYIFLLKPLSFFGPFFFSLCLYSLLPFLYSPFQN